MVLIYVMFTMLFLVCVYTLHKVETVLSGLKEFEERLKEQNTLKAKAEVWVDETDEIVEKAKDTIDESTKRFLDKYKDEVDAEEAFIDTI